MNDLFIPFALPDRRKYLIMVGLQIAFAIAVWFTLGEGLLPNPIIIVKALTGLFTQTNFSYDVWASLSLSLLSMVLATAISLLIAYASVIPFFRPFGKLVAAFRFMTLVGISYLFTILTHGGFSLKVSLLVFGITVFFTTNMLAVLKEAGTKTALNHARSLGFSPWRMMYEVMILGTAVSVWSLVRQNFAIAWMMLTMVEGISRADGGIGATLLNQNHDFHLPEVYGIQCLVVILGMGLDAGIGVLGNWFCPYSAYSLHSNSK